MDQQGPKFPVRLQNAYSVEDLPTLNSKQLQSPRTVECDTGNNFFSVLCWCTNDISLQYTSTILPCNLSQYPKNDQPGFRLQGGTFLMYETHNLFLALGYTESFSAIRDYAMLYVM